MNPPKPSPKKPQKKTFSAGFQRRAEESLNRSGRWNATASSRTEEVLELEGSDDEDGGGCAASVGARSIISHAPSLHPSIALSSMSRGCSDVTIGAGDNTEYWDYAHRVSVRSDIGHTCRECRLPFTKLNEPLTERRGARTSTRYHAECFSGFADPRSQSEGSMHTGKLRGSQMRAAPKGKAGSKMRSATHFEGGGDRKSGGETGGGKIAAFMSGGDRFKNGQSAKGKARQEPKGAAENGGLSLADIEAHNKRMDKEI